MYSIDDLKKYDYFNNIDFTYALDSLTGVLSRANILGFAKQLVETNFPFTMAIMDIDNFKLVNDNYGHMVGDGCLKYVADKLALYVGEDGLVGRFGGDEFIILYFKSTKYDDVHEFLEGLLNDGKVVRRKISVGNVKFYVTATIGCATFPNDAKNYDDLFIIADKALYRGKTKGRNCFIIYVEAKHKNIEIYRKEQVTLHNAFSRISEFVNNDKRTINERIKYILDFVADYLQISEAALLLANKTIYTSGDGYQCNVDDDCLKIFEKLTAHNNIFIPENLHNYQNDEKMNKFIQDKKIITFIVAKIAISKKTYGYIILFEDKITRIWQENDKALLIYLGKVFEILHYKNMLK
jgi:diguanylate cyclase (GGDEF)-like protein